MKTVNYIVCLVAIFGFCVVAEASHITGVITTSNVAAASNRPWSNLTNDSGMSDNTKDATSNHVNWADLLQGGAVSDNIMYPEIYFDLGAVYLLDEMRIWNYIDQYGSACSVKEAFINVSSDGVNFANVYNTIGSDPDFAENDGTGFNTVDAIVDLSEAGPIRYVQILTQGAYGPYATTGLEEVRFYEAVPEPATMALLGLGGLLLRRRKIA